MLAKLHPLRTAYLLRRDSNLRSKQYEGGFLVNMAHLQQCAAFLFLSHFSVAYFLLFPSCEFSPDFPVPLFLISKPEIWREGKKHRARYFLTLKMSGISGQDFTFPNNRTVMPSFDEFVEASVPHPCLRLLQPQSIFPLNDLIVCVN